MRTQLCDMLGCEFPVLAFSHCRDVVAAVSKAGGFGVLGAGAFGDDLDVQLSWLDKETGGRPFGVDVLIPLKYERTEPGQKLGQLIPQEHRDFVDALMDKYGVPPLVSERPVTARDTQFEPGDQARNVWEQALSYKSVKLFASALGPPPPDLVDNVHSNDALVAALVGSKVHASRQLAAGVDILVAQGYEAGGHTGEITTMVLVPEVVDVAGATPVVAAGGIATGRQVAAALALGAQGVWTGSVWLTTQEAETHPVVKEKFLAATSSDTVRSRASTGKPARQLRSAWTDEWEDPNNPKPLGMPLHGVLIRDAQARVRQGAHIKGSGSEQLINYFVGQVVGRLDTVRPARQVLLEMMEELAEVLARFNELQESG